MSLLKREPDEHEERGCPACGERLPEGAHECAMCGHRVEEVPASPEDAAQTPRSA